MEFHMAKLLQLLSLSRKMQPITSLLFILANNITDGLVAKGGFKPVDCSEWTQLLAKLKKSNSRDFIPFEAQLYTVMSAKQQVVAGNNYQISVFCNVPRGTTIYFIEALRSQQK